MEGNKSEDNRASVDPLLTEQRAQKMLLASHWNLLVHGRSDFSDASSFVTVLPVLYHVT